MPAAHASDMVSNTTGTSVEAEATLSESLEAREAVPTVPPAGLKKPQRRTSAAVVLAAMLVGGVLGWYSEDEAQAYTQRQMAQQEAAATEHTHRPVQARTPSALPPTHVLEAEPPLTPLANDAEPRQRSPRIAHTEPREDPPFVGTARALESHGDAEAERAPSLESAQPAMLMEANPYLHGQ